MLSGRVDWWVWVGPSGHHDGGAFWFWYMDALSFNRSKQRWQLQLPDEQKKTDLSHNVSPAKIIESMTVLMGKSSGTMVSEGLKPVTHPPVAQTWGGWGSTCGILYHSHHRTGAGPGNTHQEVSSVKPQRRCGATFGQLTSFSEVPHMLQHLHSMHCQRYVFTAAIMMGVNCRQDGWPACRQVDSDLQSFILTWRWGTHLSAHSRSRTPALLIGQSCGWFWSHPSRSRSNCWVMRAHLDPSLELQN